jgi:hypothetical protein
MESALQPGRFIAWNQESALVSGLEEVERGVAVLTDSDPVRAAYLLFVEPHCPHSVSDKVDPDPGKMDAVRAIPLVIILFHSLTADGCHCGHCGACLYDDLINYHPSYLC